MEPAIKFPKHQLFLHFVVVYFEEFKRRISYIQVRPSLFHCGFCNEVCPSWPTMKRHLKSFPHLERRQQQQMVADMTDDMYGTCMEDGDTADTDLLWMQLMGHRLF